MATLRMGREVYDFNSQTIDKKVKPKLVGNYALGYIGERGGFVPKYVGRSDTDLKAELEKRLSDREFGKYKKFKFSYEDSRKAAYEKECQNYHDFDEDKLDNKKHPDKPDGTDYPCPHKGCDK